jgi:ubiquinone/menaquinone biosynthesis C-methylase UbiE
LADFTLWRMNSSHSKLTDWALEHISIENRHTVLDVGGGATVNKLATITTHGKVCAIDHSPESVAATKKMNARWINLGPVEVCHGAVSQLPFPAGMFDLVTAVETHFWWADLPGPMREVFRVMNPGGTLIPVAEIYKGANTMSAKLAEKHASQTGLALLSIDEHRELCTNAGYPQVQIIEEHAKGWICVIGRKPMGIA